MYNFHKSILFLAIFITGTIFASNNEVIVYKNKSCGCCSKWVEHMKTNGFRVVEKPVDNLDEIKNSLGVPKDKRSCHTAVIGKYIFEGHVPAQSIKNFFTKNKNSKGLVVPDMPIGSPGMEHGNHREIFSVFSFDEKGNSILFESH